MRGKGDKLFVAGFLILLMLLSLFPLFLMILNSVKADVEVQANPLGWPAQLHFDNYYHAWEEAHLGSSIFLTLRIVVMTAAATGVTATLSAYALARKKIKIWSLISGYFLLSTTVPVILLIFPLYGLIVRLGLLGNEVILSLIYTALYTPFALFLMRSYFLGIPTELEEAAQIDGANGWRIFLYVVLPLVSPGIITVILIVSLFSWNEFLLSLTFFQSQDVKTAIVEFYSFQGRYGTQWSLMMATSVILAGPLILVFLILQRFFVEGLVGGSVKG
jgi:raffinose/stachyose/melibiose transport system permease protein